MTLCTTDNLVRYGQFQDFFTSWSVIGLAFSFLLQMALLIISKTVPQSANSVVVTLLKSVVTAFIANTILVTILSQCLYSYNKKAYQTTDRKPCTSIDMKALRKAFHHNFMWHILPICIALIMLVLNKYIVGSYVPLVYRLLVNVTTILLFIGAWFLVPSSHQQVGLKKLNDVYCQPRPWMAALYISGLLVAYILLNLRTFKSKDAE